jgi:hypothetical protein
MRGIWLAALALAFGACGSASQEADTTDDAAAESLDDAATDAPAEDAATEEDATVEETLDGDVSADAADESSADDVAVDAADDGATDAADVPTVDGGCDPAHETPSPSGMCDGRGILACQNWAHDNGGAGASAVCIRSTGEGCARATECSDTSDPSTCRCGTLPACLRGEVCVTYSDTSPACLCATGL